MSTVDERPRQHVETREKQIDILHGREGQSYPLSRAQSGNMYWSRMWYVSNVEYERGCLFDPTCNSHDVDSMAASCMLPAVDHVLVRSQIATVK